jgi:LAO/AO transport system kinase
VPSRPAPSIDKLFDRALSGDRRSLARLFTRIERDESDLHEVMRLAHLVAGGGSVIGVTGPPGAGKSTIVDGLSAAARSDGKKVGVLAVDPTSPFTGGAVLGDRIRMQSHHQDTEVFIRSLATRGVPGGLNAVSRAGVKLLDAVGKDVILVETVGVGQTELDVMGVADLTIVVLVPEAGDTVQTMKAGLLEIADIFVVNKSDRDGAGQIASAIRSMIAFEPMPPEKVPPVLHTQAHLGNGVPELYAEASARIDALRRSGQLAVRRSHQASREVTRLLKVAVADAVDRVVETDRRASELLSSVQADEMDPFTAVQRIIDSGSVSAAIENRGCVHVDPKVRS